MMTGSITAGLSTAFAGAAIPIVPAGNEVSRRSAALKAAIDCDLKIGAPDRVAKICRGIASKSRGRGLEMLAAALRKWSI
jgi:hypothetical protein